MMAILNSQIRLTKDLGRQMVDLVALRGINIAMIWLRTLSKDR